MDTEGEQVSSTKGGDGALSLSEAVEIQTRKSSDMDDKKKESVGIQPRKRNACSPVEGDSPKKLSKVERNSERVQAQRKTESKQDVQVLEQRTQSVAASVSESKRRKAEVLTEAGPSSSKKMKLEEDFRDESNKKKHVRRRMKYLLQAVLDQMEFYFGDSNLSKDRYLRKLIDAAPDGYVDLSVFGNFNKLQSLHKDGVSLNVLIKALKKSKMLEVNEDETKVRRTTPIKEITQEEIDNRTIYVEDLPTTASHHWIQSVFAPCGKVVYISLPTYRSTKQIKGFAFVEFESPEEAAKACSMLNNPRPAKVEEKPGRFPKGNKTLYRLQKLAPSTKDQDSNEENISDDQKVDPQAAALQGSKKKKKKKSKKKKPQDSEENTSKPAASTNQTETVELKRKKKKKKKKQNHPPEGPGTQEDKIKSNEEQPASAVESMQDKSNMDQSEEVASRLEKKPEKLEEGVETTTKVDEKPVAEDQQEKESIVSDVVQTSSSELNKKKKKRKKKTRKGTEGKKRGDEDTASASSVRGSEVTSQNTEGQISQRKLRKLQRQADIRQKKLEREMQAAGKQVVPTKEEVMKTPDIFGLNTDNTRKIDDISENDGMDVRDTDPANESLLANCRKSDGSELTSILKSRKRQERKKVEFDPVPVTTEFIKGREIRKRKKPKRKELYLRVITKKEWLSLKAEYISQQKSHMTALKESLRELRQKESQSHAYMKAQGKGHMNLEDVFGTKRLKPSQDVKMAHVEALRFIPNVIVQWKCTHEMHRDKIKAMFREFIGDRIAYIDAKEESKSGYIRFKDEASAEEFTRLSRTSNLFFTRVLPAEQQQAYWDKANEDRLKKLGRKKQEKGSEKIARKVFERNKATFHQKPSRIVFNDDDDNDVAGEAKRGDTGTKEKESKESTEGASTEGNAIPDSEGGAVPDSEGNAMSDGNLDVSGTNS